MMLYVRTGFFMGAIALLSACGGGDVAITPALNPNDAQALEASALNGLWTGDYTPAAGQPCTDVRGLTLNGRVYAVSKDCDVILTGSLTLDSGNGTASITFDLFDANGSANGSAGFSGGYTLKSQVNGSLDNGASLNLSYDTVFENDSSLVSLADIWGFSAGTSIELITISADGSATSGQIGAPGCSYTGNFGIIDTDFNIYSANIEVTGCNDASVNGSYTGVAGLFEADRKLAVLVGDGTSAFFVELLRTSIGPTN